ncbi:TonB-dependent receptor [Ohtaekwangia sp.]|uniref:TonB-dependent receptor n=1 Tax=Ohtaekwangia sp. TaxID=2066019 RepID=UPI002FDDF245
MIIRVPVFFAVLLALMSHTACAQQRHTLSGYIKDAANGEVLVGATIYIKEIGKGAVTNVYGFYSITIPPSAYTVEYSFVGYQRTEKQLTLDKDVRIDVELSSDSKQLQEVVVTAEEEQQTANVQSVEMSTAKLDIKTIRKIPAFLGEVDVIKSLQLLPGVTTVGEGASGFNVRGGSVGQNLILQDEAPVYNSSHMLGFFSAFNPDAVKDTKLYKGAIPSRYGGRLASILDVRMKDGNSKEYETTGGIGTIFSRLSFEGPIVKDKGSFIVSGRRSYIDVLARPFVDILKDGGALNFYDLTAKANYSLNDRNRVYLSGYFGRDNFYFDKNQGFNWGNATATIRWNHLFNEKLFSNITGVYSSYEYELQFGDDDRNRFKWNSSISNFILKPEFSYFISSNNELNFGAEAIYYFFEPAKARGISNGQPTDVSLDRKYNLESSLYVNDNLKVNEILSVEYGLRFSNFKYFGPGTVYTYNDTIPGKRKSVASETTYSRGKTIANFNNLQPRFSFKASLSETSSVKGSYNRMVQYLHLISNTTASNPLDVWTPTSNNIKPEIGDQFTLGYFRSLNMGHAKWEASVEGYYRKTQNQIDYIDGADLLINKYLEGDLLSGKGRAYGVEFYLQKKTGRLNGWVSYTLGRTELKVDGINNGSWYPTRYDQTHNVKVAAFYDINKRWSVSADFIFISGTPTTFPTSRYVIQGILIPENANGSRNNVRLPNYNRLDISFRLEGREYSRKGKERKNRDYWVFSVYNVYARKNAFSIYFAQSNERVPAGQPIKSEATQMSLIGSFVPAISYNFKF